MYRYRKRKKKLVRNPIPCEFCEYESYTAGEMDIHLESTHRCHKCGTEGIDDIRSHRQDCPQKGGAAEETRRGPLIIDQTVFKLKMQTLRGVLLQLSYTLPLDKDLYLIVELFDEVYNALVKLLQEILDHYKSVRISMKLSIDFYENCSGQEYLDKYVGTSFTILSHPAFINSVILNSISFIINAINAYNDNNSEWSIMRINKLDLIVAEYLAVPIRFYMPLPKCLARRHGLINIKPNKGDNNCFELCILSYLFGDEVIKHLEDKVGFVKKPNLCKMIKRKLQNADSYNNYVGTLNFDGLDRNRGLTLSEIGHFETMNDISVSVFQHDNDGNVFPARTPETVLDKHVNLLLTQQDENMHFLYIRFLSKFLGRINKRSHLFCPHCMKKFLSEYTMRNHECGMQAEVELSWSQSNDVYSFTNLGWTMRFPFVIYMYVEQLEVNSFSKLQDAKERVPVGISLLVVDECSTVYNREFKVGENCIGEFLAWVEVMALELLYDIENTNLQAEPTREETERHISVTNCDICNRSFDDGNVKTWDHNHRTFDGNKDWRNRDVRPGGYRASLCSTCNLAKKYGKSIPVFILSQSKHDFHLFVDACYEQPWIYKMVPLCKSNGEIMGLEINGILNFKDLRNFRLDMNLDELTIEMIESGQPLTYLKSYLADDKKFEQIVNLLSKGGFHLPSFDSIESMYSTLENSKVGEFIDFEDFRKNSLNQDLTIEEYNRCKSLFQMFPDISFEQYFQLVLDIKCHLIASIGQNYRDACMNMFQIDPINCSSDSAVSFYSAFLWEKKSVQLVTCPDMRQMVSDSVYGPIQCVNRQHIKSNTELYGNFDESKQREITLYVDIQSAYSESLQQDLPIGNFQWMSQTEINNFDFINPPVNMGKGFFFEVSLEVPSELHEKFNELPLLLERRRINIEEISSVQSEQVGTATRKLSDFNNDKLLLTLYPKKNISLHYKLLAYVLRQGYVLTAPVTRGFKFDEGKLFADFVQFNCLKKAQAKTKFEKNFHKSKYCTLSGRLLLNGLKDYPEPKFVFTSGEARKWIASHRFKSAELISETSALIHLKRFTGKDKDFRVIGSTVLQLSKILLFERYYGGLKSVFGPRMSLGLANTDGVIVRILDPDKTFISDMMKLKNIFYFGNLPPDHALFDKDHNFAVSGVWKIVHPYIKEYVGVKPTCYSLLLEGDETEIKCSGVQKMAARKQLRHEHYLNVLSGRDGYKVAVSSIQQVNSKLIVVRSTTTALNTIDLTRFRLGINESYSFGHCKLKQLDIET